MRTGEITHLYACNMLNTIKTNFIKNENGVETMEWLAILLVACALIGIAVRCGSAIENKMTNISKYL